MRNNMRDKLSLIRAINRVVRAEVARSWKGSVSPLEHPAIDDEAKVAYGALRELVSVILPTKLVVAKAAVKDEAGGEAVAKVENGVLYWHIKSAEEAVALPLLKGTHYLYLRPQASAAVPDGFVLVDAAALIRWRRAFSEELSAYDIDPPIQHVKTSHEEIDALLKAGGAG